MILLSKGAALAIAIAILVILAATFLISFVLYKRTPVPKGCEHIKIGEENCKGCANTSCSHRISDESEEKQ